MKKFKTVEQVAEYLNDKYYDLGDVDDVMMDIEVDGMEKFLPQDDDYDIYYGLDKVVAIFATDEGKIGYVWKTSCCGGLSKYDARVVDYYGLAKVIDDYPQYVKDGGCDDISSWLLKEYCDRWLSIDYDVMTTIGRMW